MNSIEARFPVAERLWVDEPNGPGGFEVLHSAFPESHLVLLVRDPRDVVALLIAGA